MIASSSNALLRRVLVRVTAPVVWRRASAKVRKLRAFADTELGSALDMLRAAEQEPDPRLRRQFYQHALDEFRHAEAFATMADRIALDSGLSDANTPARRPRAARAHLYDDMGRDRFLAFVHLAEKDGQAHFAALHASFAQVQASANSLDGELAHLFSAVEKDERFHVAYSKNALVQGTTKVSRQQQRRLFTAVVWTRFRQRWEKAGQQLGALVIHGVMAVLYVLVVPPFALAQRLFDAPFSGWVERETKDSETIAATSPPQSRSSVPSSLSSPQPRSAA